MAVNVAVLFPRVKLIATVVFFECTQKVSSAQVIALNKNQVWLSRRSQKCGQILMIEA